MSEALLDEVPARILAIYAHPDDPFISCGGTLALDGRREHGPCRHLHRGRQGCDRSGHGP